MPLTSAHAHRSGAHVASVVELKQGGGGGGAVDEFVVLALFGRVPFGRGTQMPVVVLTRQCAASKQPSPTKLSHGRRTHIDTVRSRIQYDDCSHASGFGVNVSQARGVQFVSDSFVHRLDGHSAVVNARHGFQSQNEEFTVKLTAGRTMHPFVVAQIGWTPIRGQGDLTQSTPVQLQYETGHAFGLLNAAHGAKLHIVVTVAAAVVTFSRMHRSGRHVVFAPHAGTQFCVSGSIRHPSRPSQDASARPSHGFAVHTVPFHAHRSWLHKSVV